MSFPSFPSTSGLKPSELHVYTIEECQSCKEKNKRDFKVGDYVMGGAGTCEKCQGQKMIVLIYGEKAAKPPSRGFRMDVGRGSKDSAGGASSQMLLLPRRGLRGLLAAILNELEVDLVALSVDLEFPRGVEPARTCREDLLGQAYLADPLCAVEDFGANRGGLKLSYLSGEDQELR